MDNEVYITKNRCKHIHNQVYTISTNPGKCPKKLPICTVWIIKYEQQQFSSDFTIRTASVL